MHQACKIKDAFFDSSGVMVRMLFLLFLFSVPLTAAPQGEIERLETTPSELASLGITYEKVDFHFMIPVKAHFWIESDLGKIKSTMDVPGDHVTPTIHYTLSYVQSGEGLVQLSATTDSPPPLNRRTGCLGPVQRMYLRETKYLPTDNAVPLDQNIEVFNAKGERDWRHPDRPTPMVRIWAHFSN